MIRIGVDIGGTNIGMGIVRSAKEEEEEYGDTS